MFLIGTQFCVPFFVDIKTNECYNKTKEQRTNSMWSGR